MYALLAFLYRRNLTELMCGHYNSELVLCIFCWYILLTQNYYVAPWEYVLIYDSWEQNPIWASASPLQIAILMIFPSLNSFCMVKIPPQSSTDINSQYARRWIITIAGFPKIKYHQETLFEKCRRVVHFPYCIFLQQKFNYELFLTF